MKPIEKLMIDKYNILKVGIDFMGYRVTDKSKLSYHHFFPKRKGGKDTIENGSIIIRWAHDYLHDIEKTERDSFNKINNLLIEENRSGRIDMDILKRIDEILCSFEEKHSEDTNNNGKLLIKDIYRDRLFRE